MKTKETQKELNDFANDLFKIFEWHNNIDCVADYTQAEKIRKKYAPNSKTWINYDEDEVKNEN